MPQTRLIDEAGMSVEEAQCDFLLHVAASGLSPRTQKLYGEVLGRFANSLPEQIYFTQINTEHIERFIINCQKHCKKSTCNSRLYVLKAWFRWAAERYNLPNPAQPVKRLRQPPPKRRILSQAEYKKLIQNTEGDVQDILRFLCNTGLRASELQNFSVNGQFLVVLGKGQKQRSIPINRTIKDILTHNPNFMNLVKSYDRFSLRYLCIKANKTIQIEPFSPHALRRFFATQLHLAGEPIKKISRMLGHSSVATTEAYIGLTNNDLLGATDVLDKL